MQISRRDLLRSSAIAGGVAAFGGLAAEAVAGTARRVAARATTLTTMLAKGEAGVGGWRPIIEVPGEAHSVRTDLGKAKTGREARRLPVLAFAQLSDVHMIDAQSPIRQEAADWVSSSAWRPQEIFCGQVADAMVREINAIGSGPVTGAPLAFAIQTGDNSDTTQYNEIRWNIDVLDGGKTVAIDSGDRTKYEGVMDQDPEFYDTRIWHPDGTPEGKEDDEYRATYGFPTIPGVLDAARQPFEAEGLAMPWYAAMGNHDGLVQGNFPINAAFNNVATGTAKGRRTVTADPDRRLLERKEWITEHFTTTGLPEGHGFTQENLAKDTAYYYFDQGIVRFVVLDTVAPLGDKGYMNEMQFTWLKKVLDKSKKKLVVLASHHPLSSWDVKKPAGKKMKAKLTKELVGRENVVAWVNGHTHRNQIWAHKRKNAKGKVVGGFWEINTASHIDWPQQSRLIEIADNKDKTISIFTTMVDHGGTVDVDPAQVDLTAPAQLAGLSRLLGANDHQERGDGREGQANARNVELLLPAPTFLR